MPPAKRILCTHLPNWSVTRYTRRHPEARDAPIAIVRVIGPRRAVVGVSATAIASGAKPGMSAAEARALCPGLTCIEFDPAADRRALEGLGRWLTRFTPVVAMGWDDEDGDERRDDDWVPPALFLDLTGCEQLFGGLARLLQFIERSLTRFNIPARMAVAPTPGAAWALAITTESTRVADGAPSLHTAIAPLPIDVLRIDDETVGDLRHLGLHRVGDLLDLPREHLPARFGPPLLKRLDQLTGALGEPLTKLVHQPPISARADFDAPIEQTQTVRLVFDKLLGLVLSNLARRNRAVRQLRLTLTPDRGWGRPTVTRTITLSRPHRNRPTLLELMAGELDRVDHEHGFVHFRLEVPAHEAVADGQTHLFDQRLVEEEAELDRLFQRLRARLGESAVLRPQWVESYLPERAWRPARMDIPAAPEGVKTMTSPPPRPLTLFPTPVEVRVVCEPSDDRDGRPRQFAWQGNAFRLTHVVGPERIAGEWWRGHYRTRDYYDVEDETGRRFWLFRVRHRRNGADTDATVARWFLHGHFN